MTVGTAEPHETDEPPLSAIPCILFYSLAILPLAVQLFLSLHNLKSGWDDAATIVAFARTWAETGRVALTPSSGVVEGFSSTSWFLLLSVPFYFTHHPEAGLTWMKLLSAFFAILSLPVFYAIARNQRFSRPAAFTCVLLLGFCSTFRNEIWNGMEMTLATFLFLLLFHILTRKQQAGRVIASGIVGGLFLMTRFEAPFQLCLLFAGLAYAAYRSQTIQQLGATARDLLHVGGLLILFFVVIEIWRHWAFGVWMPNTVYAQRFAPYNHDSSWASFATTHLMAMGEPFRVLAFPFAALVTIVFARRLLGKTPLPLLPELSPALWTLAAGCFLFGAIFGQVWGYTGRMVSATMPFLILAIIGLCDNAVRDCVLRSKLFAALILLASMAWLAGMYRQSQPVAIAQTEPEGAGANSIRLALHKERLLTMMPDTGGSTLCCENLTVVHEALLADPTLSHTGWAGFAPYFRSVNPELVVSGGEWAGLSRIYEGGLLDNYSIITAHGFRYFLRNDLSRQLLRDRAATMLPVNTVSGCMRGGGMAGSRDALYSLGKRDCLILNDANKGNRAQVH